MSNSKKSWQRSEKEKVENLLREVLKVFRQGFRRGLRPPQHRTKRKQST
jgi:hypothetical protein